MLFYTVRRLNLFIITMLILTIVGFSILRLEPNSPWALQDFWSGWFTYLGELMQLNFGVNKHHIPVIDELAVVFPATLELCFIAFILALLIGIPLGTVAGMKQGKWTDTIISFTSMAG
ncbi:peptide ABC transporter permease, partial [Vibrio xuii]